MPWITVNLTVCEEVWDVKEAVKEMKKGVPAGVHISFHLDTEADRLGAIRFLRGLQRLYVDGDLLTSAADGEDFHFIVRGPNSVDEAIRAIEEKGK